MKRAQDAYKQDGITLLEPMKDASAGRMNRADHPLLKAVDTAVDGQVGDIVVGVSGGADSVALLRALRLVRGGSLRIVVGHLDHGLRVQSADDAEWVRQLAEGLGVEVIIERQELSQPAARAGKGVEEAARESRYEFLARIAGQRGCRWIGLGHTADDQAETILHHLLRGSGLAGLRGMPASRQLKGATLIRPLLATSRSDVLQFLSDLDQPHLIDETNTDAAFTRNRIRHELLPLLREQFNPQVEAALSRLARQSADVQELVDELAQPLLATALLETTPTRVRIDATPLRSAHRHLVREALRQCFVQQNWPRQRMGFDAWDGLAELAMNSQAPRSFSLPAGIVAHFRRDVVTIERP